MGFIYSGTRALLDAGWKSEAANHQPYAICHLGMAGAERLSRYDRALANLQ